MATLQDVQRQVLELQQGAAVNAQNTANNNNTIAVMQGAVAAMQAGQMDGPRDRERSDTRMNHHAARGLQPAPWSGEDDPMAFQEFSAEFTNFANALNPGSKHLLDQGSKVSSTSTWT